MGSPNDAKVAPPTPPPRDQTIAIGNGESSESGNLNAFNAFDERDEREAVVSAARDSRPWNELRAVGQFDKFQTISVWVAAGGLLILGLSPFFKWMNFGAGGVTGLVGDGRIILAVTVLCGVAYSASVIKRRWLTPTVLVVQAWGTLCVFWMGSLIWKVGSILDSNEMKDNPFAALLATQISPGVGLYFGLLGGIVVAASLGYLAARILLMADSIKFLYVSQGISCLLGVLVASFVGPDSTPRSSDPAPGAFGQGTMASSNPTVAAPELPEIVEFGQPFVAPGFQVAIVSARIDRPEAKDMFGDIGRGAKPHLILSFLVKNTHDRRILRYREENMFLARNFHLVDDVDNTIRSVNFGVGSTPVGALTGSEDILPGEEARHIEIFLVPPGKTKYLILTMDLASFDGEGRTRFKVPSNRIENFGR